MLKELTGKIVSKLLWGHGHKPAIDQTQLAWASLVALICCLLPASVSAEPLVDPVVQYISANRTIIIGSDSGADAASQPITIPGLRDKLVAQGFTDVLVDQGTNTWLLKATILIKTTARLDITSAGVTELRLESTAANFVNITAQRGGRLVIDGVRVTSWNVDKPDENTVDGRSYLHAVDGARMDIINNSNVGYLGFPGNDAAAGIAWRKRLNPADPATGSTGRVANSTIHHNYVGLYASEAYSVSIEANQIHTNLSVGLQVETNAQQFVIKGNNIFGNGSHGIHLVRESTNHVVQSNHVHDNAVNGILVERSSNNNQILSNEVNGNQDGIAIAQSQNTLIQGNNAHNNGRGIRISASFSPGNPFDSVATNNQILGNTVANNTEHGLYLFSRADRNTIRGNTITGSGTNGIYIKSGGNLIDQNTVSGGAYGITITGGDPVDPPPAAQPLDPPGANNIIISTTVTANTEVGIRIDGGVGNRIGPVPGSGPTGRSTITKNAKEGILIRAATNGAGSTDNIIFGNLIRENGRSGIALDDAATARNRISQNSVSANGGSAIKIDGGAQGGIRTPVITFVLADGVVRGTATPNATVEVYTDPGNEGEVFRGAAATDGNGAWSLQLPPGLNPKLLTALVIDGSGNTSVFSERSGITAPPFYALTVDERNQPLIEVTDGPAIVKLADIQRGLGALNNANLLVESSPGVWQMNANLFIATGISLTIAPASGVNELRLRSNASAAPTAQADYSSFVYLRTQDGIIDIDGAKITSWDTVANGPDQDPVNGRAFVIAKYAAILNIRNAELSYLGFNASESNGVSWRDINDTNNPGQVRTRVTGSVLNSLFHHNYFGVYTDQASNMVFRNNKFYENLRFGFDAHNASHDFVVENNEAYNNGSHGFLLSRGCYNITLRGNKSYNNLDPTVTQAHGFLLDPGSAGGSLLPAPSINNLLENNAAYGNEGFGLRIVGSNTNTVRGNQFYQNGVSGISVEGGSSQNTITENRLLSNTDDGVVIRSAATGNIVTSNIISQNLGSGVYIRSSNNTVSQNTIFGNQTAGIALLPESENPTPVQDNLLVNNQIVNNLRSGIDLRGVTKTQIRENQITGNGEHGIYLTQGANQTSVMRNTIQDNFQHGIQMSGAEAFGNTWSANQLFANRTGGIAFTNNVNPNITAPKDLAVTGCVLQGVSREGWTVEVFTDSAGQGRYYQGSTVADAQGNFTFTLQGKWQGAQITALATDPQGNSSLFSAATPAPAGSLCSPLYLPVLARR
jgi:parallel beta-helix repeat protein